ncbi:hypothetical protein [Marinigracilibium pacificum]|uniref:Uncharacterized protein n=1 Tax=Marinigracilibium pacificum TaxID=2729599 RepID=A0A848ITW7_9BACT|nr:hypothetical protein [Marinigracilibium pacificum]NMM47933.1 hypothetical protein [Marinigracilibium pacificum]
MDNSNKQNESTVISTNKRFYQNSFIFLSFALVAVIIGFSRSVLSQFSSFTFVYHLHGASTTTWMVLLIIQPLLYKLNNLKLHRIIGWSTLVLVPIILIAGLIMMKNMIIGQANYPPNTVYKLAFIDITTLVAFLSFYYLALINRKNIKLHARYMVCTIFAPLIPALTRVFFVFNLADGFNPALTYSYLIIEVTILILIFSERKAKEIKVTYMPALIFMVAQHLLMYSSNDWGWWQSIMYWYAGA